MFYFSVLYFKVSLIFEDNYSKIFVLLNLICFISVIQLIKKFSFKLKYYYLVPGALAVNYDYIIWSNYLLTDFFFSFLCLAFIVNLSIKNSKLINFLLIVLLVLLDLGNCFYFHIFTIYIFVNIIDSKTLLKKYFLLNYYLLFNNNINLFFIVL